MLMFFFGFIFGVFLLEPIIINFIYFTNIDLFLDIILTKKNKSKIINHIKGGVYFNEYK